MKVQIRDREPFERLNPSEVATYLRTEGWREIDHQPNRLSVWVPGEGQDDLEILLPLRRTLGDFALRMAETIGTLAAKENRSQLEVLSDLQTAGADVIRVRFRNANSTDGSIPLAQGEALVENTREMMLAGACAAVQAKAYYSRRKPEEANRFLRGLRLGQTERGSYILTVYSPVSPSLHFGQPLLFEPPDPPFERRAITKLANALGALKNATDQAITDPSNDIFEKAIPFGVSANLCSAIVGMNGADAQPTDEIKISFTYARSRPAESSTPREIIIPGDHMSLIDEAARFYRASAPPEETEIRGAVVQLRRDDQSGPAAGPVTVMAFVEGKPRRVQIPLDEAGHQKALNAYQQGAEIACTGDLVKTGNSWQLKNPKGFSIIISE